ncbi:MAG TPA: hypothetical protein ENL28_01285 [Candidatus Atribacteria bacterium]|nr:hypothetical protein [Candidatus Atribacteria bacterium]
MAKVHGEIIIKGKPEDVYQKAKDIERLASFLPDLKEVKILKQEGSEVESFWKGEFQGREVKWTEKDIWDDAARECRFYATGGDFKKYEGVWRFVEQRQEETRVELEIEYDLGLPLVGALISAFLKKKMQENLQAMLEALKKSCEG